MKGSDVPTLYKKEHGVRTQLFLRALLPAISHHPVIWYWKPLRLSHVSLHLLAPPVEFGSPAHNSDLEQASPYLQQRDMSISLRFLFVAHCPGAKGLMGKSESRPRSIKAMLVNAVFDSKRG